MFFNKMLKGHGHRGGLGIWGRNIQSQTCVFNCPGRCCSKRSNFGVVLIPFWKIMNKRLNSSWTIKHKNIIFFCCKIRKITTNGFIKYSCCEINFIFFSKIGYFRIMHIRKGAKKMLLLIFSDQVY